MREMFARLYVLGGAGGEDLWVHFGEESIKFLLRPVSVPMPLVPIDCAL